MKVNFDAHRYVCELAHGKPSLAKKYASHKCHNPLCVNPSHLEWTDQVENMAESSKAGNLEGPKHQYKLTRADAEAIRKSPLSHVKIAKQYGVRPDYIGVIRRGGVWK